MWPGIVIVMAMAAATTPRASADLKEDFERAVASGTKGCGTIPYSGLRSTCVGLASMRDDACKTAAFSCDKLATKELRKTIDEVEAQIDRLKAKKATAKEISDKERILAKLQADLERKVREAETNAGRASSCVTARDGLIGTFDKAKQTVRSEKGAEIKPLAAILVDRYEAEEDEHEAVRDRAATALATCRNAAAGTY